MLHLSEDPVKVQHVAGSQGLIGLQTVSGEMQTEDGVPLISEEKPDKPPK